MSTFEVKIRRLKNVRPHENADRLDVAQVDGFNVVVQKGRFKDGDLAVYVPEQAVVPAHLLKPGFWKDCEACEGRGSIREHIRNPDAGVCGQCGGAGGKGMLAGPKGDRVKAVRLRGVISQGILFGLDVFEHLNMIWLGPDYDGTHESIVLTPYTEIPEGTDVSADLGIEKWVPPIPVSLAGDVVPAPSIQNFTEMENIKRFEDTFLLGEEVVATEKIHGARAIYHHDGTEFFVSSNGVAGRSLALVESAANSFWHATMTYGLKHKLARIAERFGSVHLYGELIGVQDLKYGYSNGNVGFLAFDVKVQDDYLSYDEFVDLMREFDIPTVPQLYRGEWDPAAIAKVTSGKETVSGKALHMREGVVIRPVKERRDDQVGRVLMKSISDAYLLRKGGTEFT